MPTRHRGPVRERLALDAFIKLTRATEAVGRKLGEGLAGEGLTHPQLGVLEALYHGGSMCQVELGRKLLRSPSNITAVLDGLEEKGWIERVRRDTDRRHVDVALTKEGSAVISRVFPNHARNVADAMSGLDADEQAQLAALCRKLGLSITRGVSNVER